MKSDAIDRRAFLKSAVAGTAAAATTLPRSAEAQQPPPTPAPTSEGYCEAPQPAAGTKRYGCVALLDVLPWGIGRCLVPVFRSTS
jgi:hypothetical protein